MRRRTTGKQPTGGFAMAMQEKAYNILFYA
jgi:hypothetical protein